MRVYMQIVIGIIGVTVFVTCVSMLYRGNIEMVVKVW
jgi:hypothetical protein